MRELNAAEEELARARAALRVQEEAWVHMQAFIDEHPGAFLDPNEQSQVLLQLPSLSHEELELYVAILLVMEGVTYALSPCSVTTHKDVKGEKEGVGSRVMLTDYTHPNKRPRSS